MPIVGMQLSVIEFARNVLKLENANSSEFDKTIKNPLVGLITEWQTDDGRIEARSEASDLGGTMRLGAQVAKLKEASLAQKVYGAAEIKERHRHRYEVNQFYVAQLEAAGLIISGVSEDGKLPEIVEITDHPWFIACQFHPEFTSTPRDGHPLFEGFIQACILNK